MPKKKIDPDAPRKKSKLYILDWLAYREKNAEWLGAQLASQGGGSAKSLVSKLKNEKQRYNQDWLERIAYFLQCEVADLFAPPPPGDEEPDELELLAKRYKGEQRDEVAGVLRQITPRGLPDTGS